MASLSRMEKLEEQQNMRKVGVLAGIMIVILLTAFLLGIPLMVRLAIWWGDFNAAHSPVLKTDLIPPIPPKIYLPYDATNSAIQKLSGTAEPGSTVAIGMNGVPLGNSVASDDGSWEYENVTLKEGENDFFAIAVDEAGNKSVQSPIVSMSYQSKLPDLTIDSPSDRQVVTGKTGVVEIKGNTASGGKLTINDRVIILGSGGKFVTSYQLNEGENVLVFLVTDGSGNQTRKELVVEYRK